MKMILSYDNYDSFKIITQEGFKNIERESHFKGKRGIFNLIFFKEELKQGYPETFDTYPLYLWCCDASSKFLNQKCSTNSP